jgi:hypothetical protein
MVGIVTHTLNFDLFQRRCLYKVNKTKCILHITSAIEIRHTMFYIVLLCCSPGASVSCFWLLYKPCFWGMPFSACVAYYQPAGVLRHLILSLAVFSITNFQSFPCLRFGMNYSRFSILYWWVLTPYLFFG